MSSKLLVNRNTSLSQGGVETLFRWSETYLFCGKFIYDNSCKILWQL